MELVLIFVYEIIIMIGLNIWDIHKVNSLLILISWTFFHYIINWLSTLGRCLMFMAIVTGCVVHVLVQIFQHLELLSNEDCVT